MPPHIHHWALARTIKRDPPLEFGEEYYALTERYNQQHAIYSNLSIAHALTLPHGLRLKTAAYHYNTHKPISEGSSSHTTIEGTGGGVAHTAGRRHSEWDFWADYFHHHRFLEEEPCPHLQRRMHIMHPLGRSTDTLSNKETLLQSHHWGCHFETWDYASGFFR